MTQEDIDNYFKRKEWRYLKNAENVWYARFRSQIANYQRSFEAFLVLIEDWLYVRVPLLQIDIQENWPFLMEYLLRLNYELFLVKVTLQGRLILFTADLPGRCSMADLDEVMTAINIYFGAYYLDIETMATCPAIASRVHHALQRTDEVDSFDDHEAIPDIIFR